MAGLRPWMSRQSIVRPFVNIYGFDTLLKVTLVLLWKCFGTFPYYQNSFHVLSTLGLKPRTLRFSAQTLSYHCPSKFLHFFILSNSYTQDRLLGTDSIDWLHIIDFFLQLSGTKT